MVLAHDLFHPLREIFLQRFVVLQLVLPHEFLNLRIPVPLFPVYLIPADVKIMIRKKCRHFADEFIQKFISILARRIHRRIENPPAPFDRIRPGPAR